MKENTQHRKSLKKVIMISVMLITSLLLTTILAACSDSNKPDDGKSTESKQGDSAEVPGSRTEEITETEPPVAQVPEAALITDGKTDYEIIYTENPTDEVFNAASKIQTVFQEATGIKLTLKSDYLSSGETTEGKTCKILVGNTRFAESKREYENLRYQDYYVVNDGNHIVFAAYTARAYDTAINWFVKNVLSGISADKKSLVMTGEGIRGALVKNYKISSWKIGENDMKDYRIIYSENTYKKAAMALRDYIAAKSGYYLEVVRDIKAEESKYEILVGTTNRAESAAVETPKALNYTIKNVNDKLVLKTGGVHSAYLVFEDLCNILDGGKHAEELKLDTGAEIKGDFYDEPSDISRADGTSLRLVSANVQAQLKGYNDENGDFEFARRLEIFCAFLDYYDPDVVGVQEFCPSWFNGIKKYDNFDKWEVLKFQNPKVSNEYIMSTIMYRTDRFTLVDSGMTYYAKYNNGRCRSITWAILKSIETGKEFCFVSTHWDTTTASNTNAASQAAELAAFVNEKAKTYPVFTTGDFNHNEWTETFKKYISDISGVDCMYAAKKRVNVLGSWHGWAIPIASAGSCDHITASGAGTEVLNFGTGMFNQQVYGSDHAWIYSDIKLN